MESKAAYLPCYTRLHSARFTSPEEKTYKIMENPTVFFWHKRPALLVEAFPSARSIGNMLALALALTLSLASPLVTHVSAQEKPASAAAAKEEPSKDIPIPTETTSVTQHQETWGYYPAGHMVYLNVEALKAFRQDLARFYDSAK